MIAEIALTITILILSATLVGSYYINGKEREKLMKLLMARNLQEVTENEIVEKMEPAKPTENIPSDFQEINPDDDIAFDKHIDELNKD